MRRSIVASLMKRDGSGVFGAALTVASIVNGTVKAKARMRCEVGVNSAATVSTRPCAFVLTHRMCLGFS